MEKSNIKQNSVKAWVLASRPKTLAAAAVPVMIATAIAWKDSNVAVTLQEGVGNSFHLNVFAVVLCFFFAFVMQIDANLVNDYFDCVRGNDDETRLGPKRACAQGWISLPAMRIAIAITTVIACVVGLPLAVIGGWRMILVGIACVIFCFLYTTCLSYWCLGDVLVLVFFGVIPTCCSYYVETGIMPSGKVWMMSVAVGLVVDLLLIINNYRDIDNDRKSGKRTIAVVLGRDFMEALYRSFMGIGIVSLVCCYPGVSSFISSIILLTLHWSTFRQMEKIRKGKELNVILGKTARNIFLYGILSSLSIIL